MTERQVHAWLDKFDSYNSYLANINAVDIAMLFYANELGTDGVWALGTQTTNVASLIINQGKALGQLHMPQVNWQLDGETILGNSSIWDTAATGLVSAALTDSPNAPWDGAYMDFEAVGSSFQSELSDFTTLMADALHDAGLKAGVSIRGRTGDTGPEYDGAYAYDYSVVAQVADYVDLRCYGFDNPVNAVIDRSNSPYWWTEDCIKYALSKGIAKEKMTLGIGFFSRYYPDSSTNTGRQVLSYADALALIQGNNADTIWVEDLGYGKVHEAFSDFDGSHVWLRTERTIREQLDLIDKYDLNGATLFEPRYEGPGVWDAIKSWKARVKSHSSSTMLHGRGGIFRGI